MGVLTALASAAPALLLLLYFYLHDRFDREPLTHLLAAFGLGAYAMVAAAGAGSALESWLPEAFLRSGTEAARLCEAFVLAGFVEEVSKWIVLVAAAYHWREFDEPLDGLVYGVAISLGFASVENLLYVTKIGLGVAWQRALFAVPAHALFGGTMGYYAGRAKFDRAHAIRNRALCLLLPILFHGTYDYALLRRLDWTVWTTVTLLSIGFWAFVLGRVARAQRASPYRPKTMPPTHLAALLPRLKVEQVGPRAPEDPNPKTSK
jgi:RsiW-degrading membrane proteinase PrsW (M82 family)